MRKKGSNVNEDISFGRLVRLAEDESSKIHFIGIGGVSMYSLARMALSEGKKVSGSDREANEKTAKLLDMGARVFLGHSAENIADADIVIFSHAISTDNPELVRAKELKIPCVSRAKYLGAVMKKFKQRIGVSGTHGKSTVTAMLDQIFNCEDISPTVMSGAALPFGEPIRIGEKELLIYEACEYRDSFLSFFPTVSIALNLELDHTDYFFDIDAVKESFVKAMNRASEFALICGDDENLSAIGERINTRVITFGCSDLNDYCYEIIGYKEIGFNFRLSKNGTEIGEFELNILGEFNVTNAVAAIAVALEFGIDKELIAKRIADFHGIERRLQHIGKRQGRAVYYDYAHHPTEIAASINTLKMFTHGPLTVIFKPHTFSRTKALWNETCAALSLADYLIITDVYPARETAIEGINSKRLAEQIGNGAIYCSDEDVLIALDVYTKGSIVIMGAGDLLNIKNKVINKFE